MPRPGGDSPPSSRTRPSLSTDLRGTVTHLAGREADRATYDTLLGLGRKTTVTDERVRYYSAAASARDPALARETLRSRSPTSCPSSLVGTPDSRRSPRKASIATSPWSFVQANFEALAAKRSPTFPAFFMPSLMSTFADRAHAEELANFAPAHETAWRRIAAARAQEEILEAAEFRERQIPAVDVWVKQHATAS